MRTQNQQLLVRAMSVVAGLCLAYVASFVAVDKIVAASLPASQAPALVWLVAAIVMVGFAGMFSLHAVLNDKRKPVWLAHWHIHASNGFYIENACASSLRIFGFQLANIEALQPSRTNKTPPTENQSNGPTHKPAMSAHKTASGFVPPPYEPPHVIRQIEEVMKQVAATIAPVWPLKDYVAVNPYAGISERSVPGRSSILESVFGLRNADADRALR